uniref:Uncharacterized protein n=1 Tax=Sphaerodactylus townsendi TaxID=933632 RepID=A0ACB8FBX7_9SAUR
MRFFGLVCTFALKCCPEIASFTAILNKKQLVGPRFLMALFEFQSQVEEYRQLKDTLKKMPSFQRPESFHPPHVVQVTPVPSPSSDSNVHDSNVAEHQQEVTLNGEHPEEAEEIHVEGREDRAVPFHRGGKAIEGHSHQELNIQQKQEAGEDEEQRLEQVEEEHKKELEEEEMEQAGQPERLAEDLDQTPEEHEWKEKEEETNVLHEHAHLEEPSTVKTITRYKSAYEEQLEQQRLAAQRAEQATRLREHQESLRQGRLQEQLLRQQQLQEKELSFRRQAEQDEERFKHNLSHQSHYDNLDQDIVQGEDHGTQEEDENYERHNQHPQEAEEEEDQNNANEQQDQDHQVENEQNEEAKRKAAVDDVNPADDPNNQGEDEFEEAEQEREETLPGADKHLKPHDQKQDNPEVEEHLVMVGNPDQQEDNVDEQYQEEGEEEAQGDLTEEKKQDLEHNAEEPYGENDENAEEKMNDGADQEIQEETNPKESHDENYEEEEEEDEEGGAMAAKAHRRGEM